MTKPQSKEILASTLATFLFGAVILWLGIFAMMPSGPKTPRMEMVQQVAGYLAQFVLITFVGGMITFLLGQSAKEQEYFRSTLEEEQKMRRELLDSLLAVRAQVENARRAFRLVPHLERKAGYRKAIEALLQARLDLSAVWHDTETLQQFFRNEHQQIQAGLNGMKEYLDHIIDEFENEIPKIEPLDEAAARSKIDDLRHFGAFTKGTGGQAYTEDFLGNKYRPAVRIMRRQLLEAGDAASSTHEQPEMAE